MEVGCLLTDGSHIVKTCAVRSNSRMTLDVTNESPRLAEAAVSAIARSLNSVPVVADRSA